MAAMMARRSSSHHLILSLLAINHKSLIVVEDYSTACDIICILWVRERNINDLASRKWSVKDSAI